jgi:TatD DNase family protein
MLFDSHAHLNSEKYIDDLPEIISRIEKSKLSYVMDVGFDLASSLSATKHAEANSFCYAAVGCHPHDTKDMDEDIYYLLKGLASKTKVRAIGEIGLDYFHNHSEKETQIYWFRRQIALAHEVKLPIIIHDRDAHADILSILKEERAFELGVLMHCFSGSAELAHQYVKLGAKLSIAGPVTFKNAHKLVDVVKETPLSELLIETDSPYLTPEPFRGRRNEPIYVEYVCEKIAEIKGISFEEAAMATTKNAKEFFKID